MQNATEALQSVPSLQWAMPTLRFSVIPFLPFLLALTQARLWWLRVQWALEDLEHRKFQVNISSHFWMFKVPYKLHYIGGKVRIKVVVPWNLGEKSKEVGWQRGKQSISVPQDPLVYWYGGTTSDHPRIFKITKIVQWYLSKIKQKKCWAGEHWNFISFSRMCFYSIYL